MKGRLHGFQRRWQRERHCANENVRRGFWTRSPRAVRLCTMHLLTYAGVAMAGGGAVVAATAIHHLIMQAFAPTHPAYISWKQA